MSDDPTPAMHITLRPFTPADLPALAQWQQAVGAQQYMSRCRPRANDPELVHWVVIQADGADCGTLWLEKERAGSREASLGVLIGVPGLLNGGIGRQAIRLGIAGARDALAFSSVSLRVRQNNPRAIACYQNCGFRITGAGSKIGPGGERIPFYEMHWDVPGAEETST